MNTKYSYFKYYISIILIFFWHLQQRSHTFLYYMLIFSGTFNFDSQFIKYLFYSTHIRHINIYFLSLTFSFYSHFHETIRVVLD